jgi:hypothetical protein
MYFLAHSKLKERTLHLKASFDISCIDYIFTKVNKYRSGVTSSFMACNLYFMSLSDFL